MTEPKSENQLLIEAFTALSSNLTDVKSELRAVSDAVDTSSAASDRASQASDRRVRTIQRGIILGGFGIVVLLIMAFTNFSINSRSADIARDVQNTNALLLSCLQPGTPCADQNARQEDARQNLNRQTALVVAVCQRQFPTDPNNPDPNGNTAKLVACIQSYYPSFVLPPKANISNPTPTPSAS